MNGDPVVLLVREKSAASRLRERESDSSDAAQALGAEASIASKICVGPDERGPAT